MSGQQRTGADTLRLIVRAMDDVRESFNDRFTPNGLVAIYSAHLASGWDIPPDRWTERQVNEAIHGLVPRWDSDEKPVYD